MPLTPMNRNVLFNVTSVMRFAERDLVPLTFIVYCPIEIFHHPPDGGMQVFRHYVRASEESFMNCSSITNELVNKIACGKIEVVGYDAYTCSRCAVHGANSVNQTT